MSGKGSKRRPFNQKKWDEGYDRAFGPALERKFRKEKNHGKRETVGDAEKHRVTT